MSRPLTLELPPMPLDLPRGQEALGTRVLQGLLDLGEAILARLRERSPRPRLAAVTRLRGTGRGVHFSEWVDALEHDHPVTLQAPFEGSDLVAGAVWPILHRGDGRVHALAKLRWAPGADDLPMHVHDHSDRCIIVLSGRGYFHISDQPIDQFDGRDVRSIPARERDVFAFTRGVVHTFSTAKEPMVLLSAQLPFLPFDHPNQYRLPSHRWIARNNPERVPASIQCDPSWMLLTCGW
jgi:mannose-6-phosphate isomerase-like protein (cupin superfamily)